MAYDPNKRADVFMTVEGPNEKAPRVRPQTEVKTLTSQGRVVRARSHVASEYDEVCAQMTSSPRSELFCLLMLLEIPRWMKGLWGEERNGWHDARTATFLSFADARQLIDARIKDLGLSPEKVYEYPKYVSGSWQEDQIFYRLPFEKQMERFKAA